MLKSPDFYQYYTKLFYDYFPKVDHKKVEILSLAGYQYYNSLIILDRILDDGKTNNTLDMILLQEECIKNLSSIFGKSSKFWNFWNNRRQEFINALKTEGQLYNRKEVTFNTYEVLADNKSSFGKVAIDSLYILAGEKDDVVYKTLLLSHKHFSVGFQLYDDVKDFKEDFVKEQFNYAIYKLNKVIDFDKYNQDVNILNKYLFIKEIGQRVLNKSIEHFEQAILILSTLNVRSKWLETVIEMKKTIKSYLDVTIGYLATIKTRLNIKNQNISHSFFSYDTIKDNSIKKGLNYIRSDFKQNYTEMKHIMYLGQLEGFNNKTQIHVSDTFQRAIIDDCFITISKSHNLDILDFLRSECKYLIGLRNNDIVGGWSYFPTVKEIAADIDDLGQIIQLFAFSGNHQFIDEYCVKPIRVAINERFNDGSIETWIIPVINNTQIQKRQEQFNITKWGKGPDVEVVANFIYSLVIFDKKKYYDIIEKSIAYILKQQNDMGYWESRWYYGDYYGTYVCLRLLIEFEQNFTEEKQKAIDFLVKNQNHDGGFSINSCEQSDPLSTAFAVLGLKLFSKLNKNAINKAVKYLNSVQNEDGSWKEVDFIKPKIHDPYKSRTLTTAYVLKALCS